MHTFVKISQKANNCLMIIEFSVGNFRSFKDLQTLSMVAAPIRSKNKEIDIANVETVNSKIALLRSKAIYGSNASGKSNLVKALLTFLFLLRDSIKDEEQVSMFSSEFYALNEQGKDEPIFFQISFMHQNIQYRYGYTIKGDEISAEWLYGTPNKIESYYFEREGMNVKVNGKTFPEAKKFEGLPEKGDNEIFRRNSLFISSVAAMGASFAKTIMDFFAKEIKVVSSLEAKRPSAAVVEQMSTEKGRVEIAKILRAADISILGLEKEEEEIDIESIPEEIKSQVQFGAGNTKIKMFDILSTHAVYNEENNKIGESQKRFRSFESDGTQKFLFLGAVLLNVLKHGKVLVVDEFDAHLHPLLASKIVALFHSKKTNPNGAQLIFTTHDTNFFKSSLLRRDQLCLVIKDSFGASAVRTLVEYKGIRNDASYEKDYLQGRYDAVPLLNMLTDTFEQIINSGNEQ